MSRTIIGRRIMRTAELRIGCVAWTIPKGAAAEFPRAGSHLERYAARFSAVEIDTSFYRPHRPATYARWAASVPAGFRFAVKAPRTITHERRLVDIEEPLARFLGEVAALGDRLGPLLVQLPPSLAFERAVARAFWAGLRRRFAGEVVCEPRHPSWFTAEAGRSLAVVAVARVGADPAPARVDAALAAAPGGWPGLVYLRLHGSPKIYHSAYSPQRLEALAHTLAALQGRGTPAWCIFDNTAAGAAPVDALALRERCAGVRTFAEAVWTMQTGRSSSRTTNGRAAGPRDLSLPTGSMGQGPANAED
jgi:uncharacterized protein YecE (DUF72 family)